MSDLYKRKKNHLPTNVFSRLRLREYGGVTKQRRQAVKSQPFSKLPGRLGFSLRSLVAESVLSMGHVFLGFTVNGKFLLSYSLHLIIDDTSVFPVYVYWLQFWQFVPYKRLKKISEVRLFGDSEIQQDLLLNFCEWSGNDSSLVVHGYCIPSDNEEKRQCYVTIVAVPSLEWCHDCSLLYNTSVHADRHVNARNGTSTTATPPLCILHSYAVHSRYELAPPYPAFNPRLFLKYNNTLVINTGDTLVSLSVQLEGLRDDQKSDSVVHASDTCGDSVVHASNTCDDSVVTVVHASDTCAETVVHAANTCDDSVVRASGTCGDSVVHASDTCGDSVVHASDICSKITSQEDSVPVTDMDICTDSSEDTATDELSSVVIDSQLMAPGNSVLSCDVESSVCVLRSQPDNPLRGREENRMRGEGVEAVESCDRGERETDKSVTYSDCDVTLYAVKNKESNNAVKNKAAVESSTCGSDERMQESRGICVIKLLSDGHESKIDSSNNTEVLRQDKLQKDKQQQEKLQQVKKQDKQPDKQQDKPQQDKQQEDKQQDKKQNKQQTEDIKKGIQQQDKQQQGKLHDKQSQECMVDVYDFEVYSTPEMREEEEGSESSLTSLIIESESEEMTGRDETRHDVLIMRDKSISTQSPVEMGSEEICCSEERQEISRMDEISRMEPCSSSCTDQYSERCNKRKTCDADNTGEGTSSGRGVCDRRYFSKSLKSSRCSVDKRGRACRGRGGKGGKGKEKMSMNKNKVMKGVNRAGMGMSGAGKGMSGTDKGVSGAGKGVSGAERDCIKSTGRTALSSSGSSGGECLLNEDEPEFENERVHGSSVKSSSSGGGEEDTLRSSSDDSMSFSSDSDDDTHSSYDSSSTSAYDRSTVYDRSRVYSRVMVRADGVAVLPQRSLPSTPMSSALSGMRLWGSGCHVGKDGSAIDYSLVSPDKFSNIDFIHDCSVTNCALLHSRLSDQQASLSGYMLGHDQCTGSCGQGSTIMGSRCCNHFNNSPIILQNESKCFTYSVRRFSESLSGFTMAGEFEDDLSLAYHSLLPVEVKCSGGVNLKMITDSQLQHNGPRVAVKQLTLDIEHYLSEAVRTCAEWGDRYLAFTDYDVQILDVCGESGEVTAFVFVLVRARPPDNDRNDSKDYRSVPRLYDTCFKFTWNLQTGSYRTLGVKNLVEMNQAELLRTKSWQPGQMFHRISESLHEKSSVPSLPHQSVHIMNNEPVFHGSSLRMLFDPQNFSVILM